MNMDNNNNNTSGNCSIGDDNTSNCIEHPILFADHAPHNSKEIDQAIELIPNYKKCKMYLRKMSCWINSPRRQDLWVRIVNANTINSDAYINRLKELSCFGSVALSDMLMALKDYQRLKNVLYTEHVNLDEDFMLSSVGQLTEKGKQALKNLLAVLIDQMPHVGLTIAILPLAGVLLHYMDDIQAYQIIRVIIENEDMAARNHWNVLRGRNWCGIHAKILRISIKKHNRILSTYIDKNVYEANEIYECWYGFGYGYLPFLLMVRITDCFLYEGVKVILRVAMTVLNEFRTHHQTRKAGKVSLDQIKYFAKNIPIDSTVVLQKSFKAKFISRAHMKKIVQKESVKYRQQKIENKTMSDSSNRLGRESGNNASTNWRSHTMSISLLSDISRPTSYILDNVDWKDIWYMLPTHLVTESPHLVFSTDKDGRSISHFHRLLEEVQCMMILFQLLSNQSFGIFMDGTWTQQNHFSCNEFVAFTISPSVSSWSSTLNEHDRVALPTFFMSIYDGEMINIGCSQKSSFMISIDADLSKLKLDGLTLMGNSACGDENDKSLAKQLIAMEAFTFPNIF